MNEGSDAKREVSSRRDQKKARLKYFDVWEGQDFRDIREHGLGPSEDVLAPMILIATLRASTVEDAWRQLERLRPIEMPRVYNIAKDEWGFGIGVQGRPLDEEAEILQTFWAETWDDALAAGKEFLAARRSTEDRRPDPTFMTRIKRQVEYSVVGRLVYEMFRARPSLLARVGRAQLERVKPPVKYVLYYRVRDGEPEASEAAMEQQREAANYLKSRRVEVVAEYAEHEIAPAGASETEARPELRAAFEHVARLRDEGHEAQLAILRIRAIGTGDPFEWIDESARSVDRLDALGEAGELLREYRGVFDPDHNFEIAIYEDAEADLERRNRRSRRAQWWRSLRRRIRPRRPVEIIWSSE